MMMLIGSIIGARLAEDPQWATLPIALMVVGQASAVLPATRAMARWGRRSGLWLFLLLGICASLLATQALARESFALFCSAAALFGATNAALQQVRFAAMESVPLERGPAAASVIMCAGIVAAFLGPEMALWGKDLSGVEYQGSFMLAIACFLIAGTLLLGYMPQQQAGHNREAPPRPLGEMLANPTLVLAVASGAIAYVVMSFIMTATPISMHVHHGHSLEDTKWVIQSHIAAMFLPSLLTAWLFRALSIRGLMALGLLCYAAMIVIGLLDVTVIGFWGQLVMLGVGWNFLFVAGTALLPTAHREGEHYRAQALNDTVVFSTQAVASLSAGLAISAVSWQAILLLCLVPIGVMIGLLVWLATSERT